MLPYIVRIFSPGSDIACGGAAVVLINDVRFESLAWLREIWRGIADP